MHPLRLGVAMKIRRDKRLIGRRVRVTAPTSKLHGREGRIVGFRGDQSQGNPYVQVYIDRLHVETISARSLELMHGSH